MFVLEFKIGHSDIVIKTKALYAAETLNLETKAL